MFQRTIYHHFLIGSLYFNKPHLEINLITTEMDEKWGNKYFLMFAILGLSIVLIKTFHMDFKTKFTNMLQDDNVIHIFA